MFRRPVKVAVQGDRVALCLTNLDPKLIERGVACAPGSVPLLSSVICLVKKIRFFRLPCKSNSRYHITIGHTTVIATAQFFGAREMSSLLGLQSPQMISETDKSYIPSKETVESEKPSNDDNIADDNYEFEFDDQISIITSAASGAAVANRTSFSTAQASSSSSSSSSSVPMAESLNVIYRNNFPVIPYIWDADYEYQEELAGSQGFIFGREPLQWALLQFQQPVFCPLDSLLIGSRLDSDTREGSASAQQCRLAFYGPIKSSISSEADELDKVKIYRLKVREGEVFRLTDVRYLTYLQYNYNR